MIGKDYFGARLVTDWYKRNLVMYSKIQNQLKPETKTIFIVSRPDKNFKLRSINQDRSFE